MRILILIACFVPILYFGIRDAVFHFRGRRVSVAEHLLHLAIGIALMTVLSTALRGSYAFMLGALVLFLIAGGIDEYIFHHGLPGAESDLHAKEHLALVIFLAAVMVLNWLQQFPATGLGAGRLAAPAASTSPAPATTH